MTLDAGLRSSPPNIHYRLLQSKHSIVARRPGASKSTGGIHLKLVRSRFVPARRLLNETRFGESTVSPVDDKRETHFVCAVPRSKVLELGDLYREFRKSGRRRSKRIAWRSSLIVLSSSSTSRIVSMADLSWAPIRVRSANRSSFSNHDFPAILLHNVSVSRPRRGIELPAIHRPRSLVSNVAIPVMFLTNIFH